jgi:hypothetical protein
VELAGLLSNHALASKFARLAANVADSDAT